MTRPFSDQTKAMSSEGSWDAPHCMRALSPTVTSPLDGARVILVWSGGGGHTEEETHRGVRQGGGGQGGGGEGRREGMLEDETGRRPINALKVFPMG